MGATWPTSPCGAPQCGSCWQNAKKSRKGLMIPKMQGGTLPINMTLMVAMFLLLLGNSVVPFSNVVAFAYPLTALGLPKAKTPTQWVARPAGHDFDYGGQIFTFYSSALTPALLKYLVTIGRNPNPVLKMGQLVKRELGDKCLGEGSSVESLVGGVKDEEPPRLLRFGKRGGGTRIARRECV